MCTAKANYASLAEECCFHGGGLRTGKGGRVKKGPLVFLTNGFPSKESRVIRRRSPLTKLGRRMVREGRLCRRLCEKQSCARVDQGRRMLSAATERDNPTDVARDDSIGRPDNAAGDVSIEGTAD